MKASDQINKMFHLDFFISTHRAVEMRPKSKHFLGQDINATDVTPVPNENLWKNLQILAFTFFDLYLPVGKNLKMRDIHFFAIVTS